MKKLILLLLIGLTAITIACNKNQSGDSESEGVDNPKVLAQMTLEIDMAGDDIAKHTAIYKKYGYNLVEGSHKFTSALSEVKDDPDKYKIYDEHLSQILKKKSIGDISLETKKEE